MYVPKLHQPKDLSDVYNYIRNNGFATLLSNQDNRIIATHIPLLLEEQEEGTYRLLGHIARANEQKVQLGSGEEHLAIFMESHAYISSSWYDHINVPTWNYIAVHVYGKTRVLVDEELTEAIHLLVEQYEDGRDGRFKLSDMPTKMLEAHLRGLVGFEMTMDKIESSYKLSQNRNDNDYKNIIQQLENEEKDQSNTIAQEMKKFRF